MNGNREEEDGEDEDEEEEEEEVQHDGASSSAASVSRSISGSDSGYEEEEVEQSEEEKETKVKIEHVAMDTGHKEEVMVAETETETGLVEDVDTRRGIGGGRTVGVGNQGARGGAVVVRDNGDPANGGITDAVLLLIVRCVLAGMHGFVVLKWVLGKVSEGLAWVVELGMLLLGQPPPEPSTTTRGRE